MSMKDGLTKKEKFTPHGQNPPSTKTGRPKHNEPKIKRKKGSMPKC